MQAEQPETQEEIDRKYASLPSRPSKRSSSDYEHVGGRRFGFFGKKRVEHLKVVVNPLLEIQKERDLRREIKKSKSFDLYPTKREEVIDYFLTKRLIGK